VLVAEFRLRGRRMWRENSTMSVWMYVVLIVFLGMVGMALIGVHHSIEKTNEHLKEISRRLDELKKTD
jgi:hypothetical protein